VTHGIRYVLGRSVVLYLTDDADFWTPDPLKARAFPTAAEAEAVRSNFGQKRYAETQVCDLNEEENLP
jgi:hypothetical protein